MTGETLSDQILSAEADVSRSTLTPSTAPQDSSAAGRGPVGSPLGRYLIGRIGQFFLVVVGALLLVFMTLHVVADPAKVMLPPGDTSEEQYEAFREQYGFNDPLPVQLYNFGKGALRFDVGDSIWLGGDALGHVLDRLPATIILTFPAVIGGALVGVVLGATSARRENSWYGSTLNVISFAVISIAEFWLAIMLILVFAVQLDWLPTSGYDPKPAVLVLPMIVLALRPFAQSFQLTQATMSAEYGKLYVLAARAKGVSERDVSLVHVLRNVAVPVLTLILYDLGRVFVGTAIIIEVVFAWPGIGRLAVNGLTRGDVFLVEAVVLVAATATALFNLTADMLYYAIDPRTRSLIKGAA